MNLNISIDGKNYSVSIDDPKADPMIVSVDGTEFSVSASAAAAEVKHSAPVADAETVKAPIPGTIQEVNIKEGQSVKKGDVMFVLEAMKMKNNIVAMHDGKVAAVCVSKGDHVDHGQDLMAYAG